MISVDDLTDTLWEHFKDPPRRETKKRFFSEYEIKRMITPDKILRVPGNAILSPLALDWLLLKGVHVVREASSPRP